MSKLIKTTIILSCSLVLMVSSSVIPTAVCRIVSGRAIISSGEPTISGSFGGFVTKNSGHSSYLSMTVKFGELSPINRNRVVKVVVPITVRGNPPYELSASAIMGGDTQVARLSDIGFGVQNLRQVCSTENSRPTISARFENDPASTVRRKGRASYTSSLADLLNSSVILKSAKSGKEKEETCWMFDAVLAIVPQFYPPGQFSVTVFFTTTLPSNP